MNVEIPDHVLPVVLKAVNRYIDTGDIAILEGDITDEDLADAKEWSGDLWLLLSARLTAK